MRNLFVLIIGLSLVSCSPRNRQMDLFQQYSCLLEKSLHFVNSGKNSSNFLDSLNQYVYHYKYTMSYSPDTTYDFNHGRSEYIICHPFLFNSQMDKAIVIVLERTWNLSHERVEYAHFVSAKLEHEKWFFKFKDGHVLSYEYYENFPTASDQEITLRVLKAFIGEGYLKDSSCDVNDDFFKKDWFAWNKTTLQ